MTDRTLKAVITGSSAGAVRAFEETAVAAEASSRRFGDAVESGSGRVGSAFSRLGGMAANFGIPFSNTISQVGQKFDDAGTKGQRFGQTLSTVGGMALAAGAVGIAAVAGESIHLAENFDTATSKIAAAAGVSQAAAKAIGDAFLSTAGSTTFSGTEMAAAYASVAAQLGLTEGHALTASQALTVMRASADLAEASGTDLNTATQSLAGTMQAFGLKATEANSAADVLYNTSKSTGTTVDGVTTTFQKLHSALGEVSPPLAEMGGLVEDLASHGETGRKALSAVSSAMTGLLTPTLANNTAIDAANSAFTQLPTNIQPAASALRDGTLSLQDYTKLIAGLPAYQKDAASQFATLIGKVQQTDQALSLQNVTVQGTNGKFVGMASIIDQLKQKIDSTNDPLAKMGILQEALGTSSQKLLDVVEAGPAAFQKYTDQVSKSGSAHDAATKATDNLHGQIDKLKATAEDYGVRLGNFLIPKLETLMHATADVVNWFQQHKVVAEVLAGVLGGALTAAIGVYVINLGQRAVDATSKAISSISNLISSLFGQTAAMDATAADSAVMATTVDGAYTEMAAGAATSAGAIAESNAAIGASMGEAGLAGNAAAAESAVGGLGGKVGMLGGSLGLVSVPLAVVTAGLAAGYLTAHALNDQWDIQIQQQNKVAAGAVTSAQNIAQVAGAQAVLHGQIDQTTNAMNAATNSGTGFMGALDHIASAFGESVVTQAQMRGQLDNLNSAYEKGQALAGTYGANVEGLASKFGLSKEQVEILANSLGIDLTQALSMPALTSFSQRVTQDMGTVGGVSADVAAVVSQNMQTMSLNASNAATNTHLGIKAALDPLVQDLVNIGQNSTAGLIAQYITAQGVAGNASKGIHDATMSQMLPLIPELLQTGDLAAAGLVSKLVAYEGPVAGISKSIHLQIKDEIAQLVPELEQSGDQAGLNLVNSIIAKQASAATAGQSIHDAVYKTLLPLEAELRYLGDTSGADMIQQLVDAMTHKEGDAGAEAKKVVDAVNAELGDTSGASAAGAAVAAAFAGALGQATADAVNSANFLVNQGVSQARARGLAAASGLAYLGGPGNTLPVTAEGGIFTSPQIRMFAEKGPEAVLPLTDYNRSMKILATAMPMMGASHKPDGPAIIGANGGTTLALLGGPAPHKPDPRQGSGSGANGGITIGLNPPAPVIPPTLPAGPAGSAGLGSSGPSSITNNLYIYAQVGTPADAAADIADKVVWALKTAGV